MILLNSQNIEEPYLDPEVSMVDVVVHRGRSVDVDTVMVDGEIIMRDKQLTQIDKQSLFAELKKELDRRLSPSERERRDLSGLVEPHLRQFYIGTIPQSTIPHTNYNARS